MLVWEQNEVIWEMAEFRKSIEISFGSKAAVDVSFFADNKDTKMDYWKGSDVWKQVETVFNNLNKAD